MERGFSGLGLFFLAILAMLALLIIAAGVFYCVCNWKILVKAGKPGWHSLIPVFNLYQYGMIASGRKWMSLVLALGNIPFFILKYIAIFEYPYSNKINIVIVFSLIQAATVGLLYAYVTRLLMQRFGRNKRTSLLYLVLGGWIVTLAVLASSRAVYKGNDAGGL